MSDTELQVSSSWYDLWHNVDCPYDVYVRKLSLLPADHRKDRVICAQGHFGAHSARATPDYDG